jgi:DNA-binding transcriptional ArsR family regulator
LSSLILKYAQEYATGSFHQRDKCHVEVSHKHLCLNNPKLDRMEAISELEINILELRKAALIFRAINHKLRQDMLKLIHKAGKITVTELYRKMNLEQSVASQHLAILRTAGFVITERERRFVFYKVNYKTLEFVEEQSRKLIS